MTYESKLIPILRDGVDMIKMIFFRKLKAYLSQRYSEQEPEYISRLTGAIVNELFGIVNTAEPFASFTNENRACIREEMRLIPMVFEEMRIPLTDALRVQFLCDSQEGIDSAFMLERAGELGILISDREIPLPNHFINLVRTLGYKFNLLNQISKEASETLQ